MFYRSARHFRILKSAVRWDLSGKRAGQWRTEPRLAKATMNRVRGGFLRRKRSSGIEFDSQGAAAQGHDSSGVGLSKSNLHFRQLASNTADRVDHSSRSIASHHKAGGSPSVFRSPPSKLSTLSRLRNPMRYKETISGTMFKRQSSALAETKFSSISLSPSTTSVEWSGPAISYRNQSTAAELTRPGPFQFNHAGLPTKSTMYQGSWRDHDHSAPEAREIGRHDAAILEARTMSGIKLQQIVDESLTTRTKHRQTIFNAPGGRLTSHIKQNAFIESKPSIFDKSDAISSRDNMNSVVPSSSVVGELWLDTLSLRDWLNAFLTGEIGRAFRATNSIGVSLAQM